LAGGASEDKIDSVKTVFGPVLSACTGNKSMDVILKEGNLREIVAVCLAGEAVPFDSHLNIKSSEFDALAKPAASREQGHCCQTQNRLL